MFCIFILRILTFFSAYLKFFFFHGAASTAKVINLQQKIRYLVTCIMIKEFLKLILQFKKRINAVYSYN